jgi:polyribonucleotide nucleotidyltransferase
MDIKIGGITPQMMHEAMEQAKAGRTTILERMDAAIAAPRGDVSAYAPRMVAIKIDPDKIKFVIGPGGSTIRGIQRDCDVTINVEDDGTVTIAAVNAENSQKARDIIEGITQSPQVGKTYEGKITSITDFGAFVELFPGTEGLCHVSELSDQYVERVADVVTQGERIQVRVLAVDDRGRIKLSRRVLLREAAGLPPEERSSEPRGDRPPRSGGDDRPRRRREGGGGGGGGRDRGPRRDGGDRGPREGGDRGPDSGSGSGSQQQTGGGPEVPQV